MRLSRYLKFKKLGFKMDLGEGYSGLQKREDMWEEFDYVTIDRVSLGI